MIAIGWLAYMALDFCGRRSKLSHPRLPRHPQTDVADPLPPEADRGQIAGRRSFYSIPDASSHLFNDNLNPVMVAGRQLAFFGGDDSLVEMKIPFLGPFLVCFSSRMYARALVRCWITSIGETSIN